MQRFVGIIILNLDWQKGATVDGKMHYSTVRSRITRVYARGGARICPTGARFPDWGGSCITE